MAAGAIARKYLGERLDITIRGYLSQLGPIELQAIDKPQKAWDSPLAAFQTALAHEEFITGKINELAKLADEENDRAAGIMLQWFVTEQVEEEDSVSKVIDLLGIAGEKGTGLLMADRELGQRVAGLVSTGAEEAAA